MQEPAFLSGTTWLQPLGRSQLFPLSLWSGNPSTSLSWSPESTQVHLYDGERDREILRSFSISVFSEESFHASFIKLEDIFQLQYIFPFFKCKLIKSKQCVKTLAYLCIHHPCWIFHSLLVWTFPFKYPSNKMSKVLTANNSNWCM